MTKEDMQLLYEYNWWANHEILNAVSGLTASEFTRNLSSSHSSVRDTLTHILWAESIWLERWQGQSPRDVFDPAAFPGVGALREAWREIEAGQVRFLDQMTDEALTRVITYENMSGEEWSYPLGQMMLHLSNHSSYHRGQVTTMLRQLGKEAVPLDFLVFIDVMGGGSVGRTAMHLDDAGRNA